MTLTLNMQILQVTLTLALVATSCLARYSPVLDLQDIQALAIEQAVESVPSENHALHMIQNGVHLPEAENETGVIKFNIPQLASKLRLHTLASDLRRTGLNNTLSGKGPFTVFGPTDQAFARLPAWAKQDLKNRTTLTSALLFHVLPGEVKAAALKNEALYETASRGRNLRVNIYKKEKGDVVYTAQCKAIDLNRVDQLATNGLIHVLNDVIIPPVGNAVQLLGGLSQFKTLVYAVKVAGLLETLSGPGPFTVFAPTDRAFAKLPPGVIEKLVKNPTELAKILTYHVVSGTYCSLGLTSGAVKTLEGQNAKVTIATGGVTVNNARVIYPDASITNGVIHVIDTVLLPRPSFSINVLQ